MNLCSRIGMTALLTAWLPLALAQEPPPRTDTKQQPTEERQKREEMQKETIEAVDAIRDYSIERRNEAVARARESLAEADRRMDRMEAQMNERWSRMSGTARQRSREAMTDLRRRRSELAEWTGGLQHGSNEAWDEVKAGFVENFHDFADAMRKARAQFDRDQAQDSRNEEMTSREQQQEQER
jgi:hypothetical protein